MSAEDPAGPAPDHAHAVGTLTEEAGQLLDAVAVRLARMKLTASGDEEEHAAADGVQPDLPPPGPDLPPPGLEQGPDGVHGAEQVPGSRPCVGWCPLCRSAELLKGDRPELAEKLVDAALLLVTTLRALIPPQVAATHAASTSRSPTQSGVERIDIR